MNTIEMKNSENVVLFIHGLSSSPLEMMSCAHALYKAGFSVRVPHYSTFGLNSKDLHKGVIEPWERWREELYNDFRQMKKEYNKIFVVGFCFGAILALDLVLEFGNDITALALLSTPFFYDGWAMPWYQKLMPFVCSTPLKKFLYYEEREPYGVKNEAMRKVIKTAMKRYKTSSAGSAKISLTGIYEAYLLTKQVKKNLSKISHPLLVIHAQEDETASVRNVAYLQENIQSANLRILLLQNSYHMITLDNEKEMVASEITNFFSKKINSHEPEEVSGE